MSQEQPKDVSASHFRHGIYRNTAGNLELYVQRRNPVGRVFCYQISEIEVAEDCEMTEGLQFVPDSICEGDDSDVRGLLGAICRLLLPIWRRSQDGTSRTVVN